MALTKDVQTDAITLTPAAADAVLDLLAKRELDDHALRIFVSGGGCSGFQYGMALEGNIRPNDLSFEMHGVKIVVDEISINYLHGATVDFVEEILGGGFKVDNPNATASCGCGNSSRTSDSAASQSSGGCGCG